MEIAGLAIGVAGLAGLFGACMGAMGHIHSYKISGHESSYIIAVFEADKLLFQKWADGVGIAGNRLKDVHHPDLDNAAVASVVRKILSSIRDIFIMTDSISSKLLMKSIDNEILSLKKTHSFSKGNFINMENSQPLASKRARISWALVGKTNLTEQVEAFGSLIQKLYEIVPIKNEGDFLTDISALLAESKRSIHEVLDLLKGETKKALSFWLDATTTHQNFELCLSAHIPGTCDWIFRNAIYLSWASPNFENDLAKFLWVYGPAGHGKSVLCARIIKSLIDASASPVAYFFCSSDVKSQREPLAIIRSWISQAVACNENALEQAMERFRAKEMDLASRTDIWELFRSIVTIIPNFTFVVDGLDECYRSDSDWKGAGNSGRINFLMSLKASVAHTRSRILIVSRDEGDIRSEISPGITNTNGQRLYECRISKKDLNFDITLFSKSVVNRKLDNKDRALREDLAAQMAEKCDGMFLLIRLQENQLSRSKNRKQLQTIVNNMPSELEHAYKRDWEHISKLASSERLRALAILRWVIFALRPLTILEITEALVIEDNDNCDDLQIDELPDDVDKYFVDEQIIGPCGSLLEIRTSSVENKQLPGSSTIHLAHFSVKEYLLSMLPDKSVMFSNRNFQHNQLARLCLRYLDYTKVWTADSSTENDLSQRSFLDYAVRSWHIHAVMDGESDQELIFLTNRLFTPGNPTWNRWRKHFEFIEERSSSGIDQTGKKPGTLLYYAALFGFVDTIKFLQTQRDFDLNELSGRYGTALQAAFARGHLSTVKFLIHSGADVNIQGGEYDRAIFAAINSGHSHFEMVELLLDKGADIGIMDQKGNTPLMVAIRYGHIEAARLLLDRGANLSVANHKGVTPLIHASCHIEMVKLLLDRGADPAVADQDGDTPLANAIWDGHIEVARLLLDRGANLSVANHKGGTPLMYASYKGHIEMVKLLLDRGADPALAEEDGDTPLTNAIWGGHIDVARLLLDRGVNPSAANHKGVTPLSCASYKGPIEMVKLLLDRSADTAVVDQAGETPLNYAMYAGHIEIARLLLERGVNFTIADHHGNPPIHQAAQSGHLEVVRILLDKGADQNVIDHDGDSSLTCAIYDGQLEVTRLLLDRGANPAIVNNEGFTPLSLAANQGHLEITKFLLDRGVDAAVPPEYRNRALDCATAKGHHEILELLKIHFKSRSEQD